MKLDFTAATIESAAEAFEGEWEGKVAVLPNLRVFRDGQELGADEILFVESRPLDDEDCRGMGGSVYRLLHGGERLGDYLVDAYDGSTVVFESTKVEDMGKRLRATRETLGWTQAQVADWMQTKIRTVSLMSVSRWERGIGPELAPYVDLCLAFIAAADRGELPTRKPASGTP